MPEGHKKHRYKLVYFQGKGRGEPIRLIFHHFGVDFDDIRLSQEEWQAHKQLKIAPMDQLPYLVVDDEKLVLCQSMTIARYLAKSFGRSQGFAGKGITEAALSDMYADGVNDIITSYLYNVMFIKDDAAKKKASKEFYKTKYTNFLDTYQEALKNNSSKHENSGHFLVGKQLTYADFVFACALHTCDEVMPKSLKNHSLLNDYLTYIKNLPTIKDYIEKNW
uniref:Uncharacterized protein n=1 Tax=Acrobeloides nanus TaxID=290746 RepID=A0A914C888_9BILA